VMFVRCTSVDVCSACELDKRLGSMDDGPTPTCMMRRDSDAVELYYTDEGDK
jgi:hypothetical protein